MMLKEEDFGVQGKEVAFICQLVELEPVHPNLLFPLSETLELPYPHVPHTAIDLHGD